MNNQNKKSLNDILDDYQKIENELISNDGEISEELEKKLNIHEKELGDKLNGYEHFVRYLKGKIDYLKDMEEHYSNRRKILENSIKKCKVSMVNSLLLTGNNKIKTDDFNFSLGRSEKWEVDLDLMDDKEKTELISEGLAENIFKAKLSDIKAKYNDYKDNGIPQWIKIEESNHIKVR